jgi:hypothetical protein
MNLPKFARSLALASLSAVLVSCNLYTPFGSTRTDEGKVEQALKCLHESPADYACAIENYSAISDATEKNRRLCQVNLARAGLTLSVMINTLGSGTGDASVLGEVANAIIPWTQEKDTAVEALTEPCDAYAAATAASEATDDDQFGSALRGLSAVMACAVRMAKTDQFVGSSDSDTECTTAGNGDKVVTSEDISDNADGTISAKGMCSADAIKCRDRLATVGSGGGDQNISDLLAQFSSLTGVSAADAVRNLLRTKTAN